MISNSAKKDSPLKIVFFSHSPFLDGAERSLLQLVTNLYQENKIEPLIVLPWKGRFESALEAKDIPYVITAYTPWWVSSSKIRRIVGGPIKWTWNHLSWHLIKKQVQRFQPDLIYINTLVSPCGYIASKDLGVPVVWHVREFIPKWLQRDYDFGKDWSLKKVAKSAAVICNSNAVQSDLMPYVPGNKCNVVYNGIKLDPFCSKKHATNFSKLGKSPDSPIKLLMVGGIQPNKSPYTAIECIAYLQQRSISAFLTFVGEEKKNYGSELRDLSTRLGVKGQIDWIGWQDDPKPYYQQADITLVCSKGEPFGRTIIESMEMGTPVICSSSGGAPEIIEKVDPSLLFAQGDSEALGEVIIGLINSPDRFQEIARKGREVVENNFDIEIAADKIFQIMLSAAGR